jgi:tetratricopeptide (TPR) repeat protein
MTTTSGPPSKPIPDSVRIVSEKRRAERVQRLRTILEQRLDNPIAVLDALLSEAAEGDTRPDLWEQLHAAAARDGGEAALGDAYTKCVNGPRMPRLAPGAQAEVLMHAADFCQGVRGNHKAAEAFLERVLALVPGHPDAFARLERRLEKALDARRLVELYASIASAPPRAISVLATQVYNRVLQLGPKDALPDAACKALVALVPTNPRLLDALEAHCRATRRPALACALIEQALAEDEPSDALTLQRTHRLLELYLAEAGIPTEAIVHVERLLERDPTDAHALKAGEKLLSKREVASRAAAALQAARNARKSVRPAPPGDGDR